LPVFSRFLAIRRARSADVLEHFDLVNSELLIFDALQAFDKLSERFYQRNVIDLVVAFGSEADTRPGQIHSNQRPVLLQEQTQTKTTAIFSLQTTDDKE
jgi:hypothetical protein